MKYPRILAALRTAKWAALPSTIQAVHDALSAHMRGASHTELIPTPPGPPSTPNPEDDENENSGVCVIPVYGIIGKNLSVFESRCGGVDVNTIDKEIEMAVQDPECTCILLDFDSPGGVVSGVPELAEVIRDANEIKPIYAFTGAQCCSAAYWLASQCEAVACTISADVGSVGVYMALCDDSEWWSKNGYKLELIKAGQFKAMGISGQPVAPAERALMQADVDSIYAMFTADVRTARGALDDAVLQGQTFMGQSAIDCGMCDELVSGIDEMIDSLAAEHAPSTIPYG